MLALGVQRVARDDRVRQVGDGVQQRLEAGDLVRLLADVELGQDQAGGVVEGGEQVDLAAFCAGGSAQALAVDGEAAQTVACTVAERSASQRPTARSSASPSMRASSRRDRCLAGHRATLREHGSSVAHRALQDVRRGVGDPLADRQQRGRAGQHRARRSGRARRPGRAVPRVGHAGRAPRPAAPAGPGPRRVRLGVLAELVKGRRDQR